MNYLLGVDFGGGACKATLLSSRGDVTSTASAEIPTISPQPGWTEQNPCDWYAAITANVRSVLDESGVKPGDIAAICLDAATHTAVLCGDSGEVLQNAIYWTDTRSAEQAERLKNLAGELILQQSYHHAGTIWTLPQLLWVKENRPELWRRIHRIMFAKDYIRARLTGEWHTDYIEAQGSMLYDFTQRRWSPELCGLIDLDMSLLPPVVKPTQIVGKLLAAPAAEMGLAAGTPLVCGTTDTALELLAAGCAGVGDMSVKLATAGRICVVTDIPFRSEHLVTYSHVQKNLWYPGAATKSCAASLRWYRDTFGGDYASIDASAATAPRGCDGLTFHPYLNGELTPYANPKLSAGFGGIRSFHRRAHFDRAVLEGVAMSLLDCLRELERIGLPLSNCAKIIGGGAKSALWRQIVSDVLGLALEYPGNCDSSLGAAMLAGVALGIFDGFEDAVTRCCHVDSLTVPDAAAHDDYLKVFDTYKKRVPL